MIVLSADSERGASSCLQWNGKGEFFPFAMRIASWDVPSKGSLPVSARPITVEEFLDFVTIVQESVLVFLFSVVRNVVQVRSSSRIRLSYRE